MGATLALLAFAVLPHAPRVIVDRVDRIDLNHVQCPLTGAETIYQVIYWRWDSARSCYVVGAWRLADQPSARFKRVNRGWVETREDGPVRREIHAEQLRETRTFVDPEFEDRAVLPAAMRHGLRPTPK